MTRMTQTHPSTGVTTTRSQRPFQRRVPRRSWILLAILASLNEICVVVVAAWPPADVYLVFGSCYATVLRCNSAASHLRRLLRSGEWKPVIHRPTVLRPST